MDWFSDTQAIFDVIAVVAAVAVIFALAEAAKRRLP